MLAYMCTYSDFRCVLLHSTNSVLETAISLSSLTSNTMTEHQVIRSEPTGGRRGKKVDKNGDEIIAEAECYRSGVFCAVCSVYREAGLSFTLPLVYYCIAACCGCKAAQSWKLYLTRTGIRYTDVIECCCCSFKDHFIPLSDIGEVQVVENTIRLKMHPGVEGYPLTLCHVLNAEEFASAVRGQMAIV